MAQVRKYQGGGGLYINGKRYTAEQINEFLNQGGFDSQERAALAGTVNAIASGARRDLDRNANSISGDNVQDDFTNFYGGNEKRAARNRSGRSTRWQNRQATWNTDHHTVNTSISKLGGIEDYFNNKTAQTQTETPETKALGYGSGWFYNNDGNYVTGPTNASNEKIIRDAFAWLAGDENYRKDWTTDSYGEGLNGLVNWYNGQNVDELINRIKNKTLTAEDYDVLSKLGFSKSDTQIQEEKEKQETSDLKAKFANAGYDYDTWSPYFEFDEDGNMVSKADFKSTFGGSGNYWFNQNFANANEDLAFLKGHFLIGNRLYKESDADVEGSDLYKYLRRSNGFYSLNNAGRYDDADALIGYKWGTNSYIRPDTDEYLAGNFYGSGVRIDNSNYRTADTGIVGDGYTFQDGDQVVRYVDLNTPSNAFGLRDDVYAIIDRYGNYRTDTAGNQLRGLSSDYFSNLLAPGASLTEEEIAQQNLARETRVSSDKDSLYYNRYKVDANPFYDLYVDPTTGDAVMNPKDELGNTWLSGNQKGIKIPKEVAEILQKPEFLNALRDDPDFAKKFRNTIQSLTGTDWQDLFKRNLVTYKDFPTSIANIDAWKIIDSFYKRGSNAPGKSKAYTRRNNERIVDLPQSNKRGGILPKFQSGGAINAGSKQVERKPLVKQPVKSHTEQARLGIDKLSAAEKAELISVGMDVAGTVAGLFGPVGDFAGSTLGLGASATQLGADISRAGKLTWKDAGRFAVNAGLDVVGLVPFFGDAARSAKTIKNIKKVSKYLSPIFMGLGLAEASKSVVKIMNGEPMTADDWGNLAAGFQAITNAGVLGKARWGRAKVDSEVSKLKGQKMPDYKAKIDKSEVIITADEFAKNINGKSRKDVETFLVQKAKAAGVADNKLPKDIIEQFGLTSKGIGNWKWGKVSDPHLPEIESERSVLGSFFSRKLDSRLSANPQDVRKVLTTNKNINPRVAASLSQELGLGLPTYRKSQWRWTRMGSPKVTQHGNEPWPIIEIEPSLQSPIGIKPKGQPWVGPIKMSDERGLVPISGQKPVSETGVNFKREFIPVKWVEQRRINDIHPVYQPRKPRALSAPEVETPGIIVDKNGKVVSMDRSAFNRMDSVELNTMNLHIKAEGYRQAFNNVNNEKSFRRILENMSNDIEFRLAMEENPGILREEMLAAAQRAGLMGSARKQLVGSLRFKEGGKVLKGQKGLFDIVKNSGIKVDLSKLDTETTTTQPTYNPFAGTTGIVQDAISEYTRDLGGQKVAAAQAARDARVGTSYVGGYTAGLKDYKAARQAVADANKTYSTFVNGTPSITSKPKVGNPEGKESQFKIGNFIDPVIGGAELINSIHTTNKMAEVQAKGINEAARAQMMSNPTEIYDRQTINAGDAYRNEAKRQIDALPAVNSDYIASAAMERVGKDMANQYLIQADLADSQQHTQNLAGQSELQRMYADARRQTEAQNRQVEGQRLAALSQVETARLQSNRQSMGNAAYEFRNRLDTAKQAAEAQDKLKAQYEMAGTFDDFLTQRFKAAYDADPNKGNYTLKQWLTTKPEYADEIAKKKQELQERLGLQSLSKDPLSVIFEKGGKIRPAKEQIEINRKKSQDQLWVNQNKATQKAIDQLNKQAIEFLKMMLS